MKRAILLTIMAIALMSIGIAIGAFITGGSQAKNVQAQPQPPTISQLLTLVNVERAKNGVASLKEDPRLDASAQMKANDEVAYNYYGHISPETSPHSGLQGYDYINDVGISCQYDSENLDENSTDAAAVNAWIGSVAHHQAMIDPKYTLTGFGIAGKDSHGYYQFVEHFCQV